MQNWRRFGYELVDTCPRISRRPGRRRVIRFLDYSSLAVTTTYLRRLEGQEDRSWAKVAEAIGV